MPAPEGEGRGQGSPRGVSVAKEYVACYAFGKRQAPLGPLGPEETTVHVGQPGFFSLGYTLCRRKVSRRISTSPSLDLSRA